MKAGTLRTDCQVPLILLHTQKKLITFTALISRDTTLPRDGIHRLFVAAAVAAALASKYIGNKIFGSLFFMSLVSKEKPLET